MQRRSLLKNLLSTSLVLPLCATAANAPALRPPLAFDAGRWSPLNASRIATLIKQFGSSGPRYDPLHRPYVVFDWDNTCIMNDCEEALFMYLIEQQAFALTPEQFAAVLRQDVPDGPFKVAAGYTNVAGKPVQIADIADDVDAAYRWLYMVKAAGASAEEITRSAQFHTFRAKLYFMYEAICDSHPIEIGYKWIIRFFANMTPSQLQSLAAASHTHGLGDALRKVRYESAPGQPGKAGVVAVSYSQGLRINEEIRALMHALRANGIDVFVSTASLDDVVRVFAADPNFGYGVAPENVIGLRLEMQAGRYTSSYRKDWHFNWGPGKTVGIRTVLGSRGDPLMVFGDSDGDAWMLRDFAGTALGVIINRVKGGEIGALSQLAAASLGQIVPRFVLQGRNEHTGIYVPNEATIKYGQTASSLLA